MIIISSAGRNGLGARDGVRKLESIERQTNELLGLESQSFLHSADGRSGFTLYHSGLWDEMLWVVCTNHFLFGAMRSTGCMDSIFSNVNPRIVEEGVNVT